MHQMKWNKIKDIFYINARGDCDANVLLRARDEHSHRHLLAFLCHPWMSKGQSNVPKFRFRGIF